MNRLSLLKKMLPGLLPLFVFIIIDSVWGTEVGIIFAIVFGIAELLFIYLKEKRIDKFVIGDTLLLVVLGAVSILLENEIFFLLKPALLEAIFCIIIGISAFSPQNIMLKMSQRYVKGIELNELAVKQFTRNLKYMFWIFIVHIALIVYSAYYMSKEAWVFISGILLYIMFGVFFIVQIIVNKRKMNNMN